MAHSGKIDKAAAEFILKLGGEGVSVSRIKAELHKRLSIDVTEAAVNYHLKKDSRLKLSPSSPPKADTVKAKRGRKRKTYPDYLKAASIYLVNERGFTKERLGNYFKKNGHPMGKDSLRRHYWFKDEPVALHAYHHTEYLWPEDVTFPCPWPNKRPEAKERSATDSSNEQADAEMQKKVREVAALRLSKELEEAELQKKKREEAVLTLGREKLLIKLSILETQRDMIDFDLARLNSGL